MKLQKYVSKLTQCNSCSSHIYNDSTFSSIAFIVKPEGESDRVGTRCLIDIIVQANCSQQQQLQLGSCSCYFNSSRSSRLCVCEPACVRCPVLCRTNLTRMEKRNSLNYICVCVYILICLIYKYKFTIKYIFIYVYLSLYK